MKLLKASKSSTATKSISCKQEAGSSRTNGRVMDDSSQLSRSLVLSNSSTELSSVAAPSCLLLEYKCNSSTKLLSVAAPSCPLL
ncbi:hypothetical protein A2U01_0069350, partial [Trifolium medium]|nr:hypothetical protein [Trifolium medium]